MNVKQLTRLIMGHKLKIRELEAQVKKVQSTCEHEYKFSSVLFDPCRTLHEYECVHCQTRTVEFGGGVPSKVVKEESGRREKK